jgi:ribosomal protein S18 acetylase RimI-like enzyme
MITYRSPTMADAPALAALGRRTFVDTFGPLYAPGDLAAFLDEVYDAAVIAGEIASPERLFRVAARDEAGETGLVGFCKLGLTSSLPVELGGRRGLELKQLYVLAEHHGQGVAAQLMDWALAEAKRRAYDDVILSVYGDNTRAQRFYQRYGFSKVGDHFFMVGSHRDDEHLYRLSLTP